MSYAIGAGAILAYGVQQLSNFRLANLVDDSFTSGVLFGIFATIFTNLTAETLLRFTTHKQITELSIRHKIGFRAIVATISLVISLLAIEMQMASFGQLPGILTGILIGVSQSSLITSKALAERLADAEEE